MRQICRCLCVIAESVLQTIVYLLHRLMKKTQTHIKTWWYFSSVSVFFDLIISRYIFQPFFLLIICFENIAASELWKMSLHGSWHEWKTKKNENDVILYFSLLLFDFTVRDTKYLGKMNFLSESSIMYKLCKNSISRDRWQIKIADQSEK